MATAEFLLTETWKRQVKDDFKLFEEDVLGFPLSDHQVEWCDIVSNDNLRNIVIAAPRGHTKTTTFSVNYPLWELSRNKDVRILLVSNAESQAQSFLREIVARIERDQNYVDFAGQLKPKIPEKWTAREIIVDRDAVNIKDPSVSTVGMGGTILSKRADVIICDDILNFENTRTFEQRQKMKEWFYQVLMPVLVPGGRVVFVGTVWQAEDLLHELLADPSWDYRKKFKAVISWPENMQLWDDWYKIRMAGTAHSKAQADRFVEENFDEMHKGVEILWDVFPFRMHFLNYKTNRVAFEKAYQNNIVSREDQKFKEEWLDRAKVRGANMRLTSELTPDQRKEYKILTSGVDLAAKKDQQSDDNAMLTIGQRRLDDMVVLMSIMRGKYTPSEWRNVIREVNSNLRPDKIIVESNAYQITLQMDLAEENMPISAFNTGGEKFDPFIGVESLAILFENDRIILPYDKTDPVTISLIDQLVDELRQFPAGHTGDSAMALWFSWTGLRSIAHGAKASGFLQMAEEDLKNAKHGTGGVNSWVKLAKEQGRRL